jgi:hypothetical protein
MKITLARPGRSAAPPPHPLVFSAAVATTSLSASAFSSEQSAVTHTLHLRPIFNRGVVLEALAKCDDAICFLVEGARVDRWAPKLYAVDRKEGRQQTTEIKLRSDRDPGSSNPAYIDVEVFVGFIDPRTRLEGPQRAQHSIHLP